MSTTAHRSAPAGRASLATTGRPSLRPARPASRPDEISCIDWRLDESASERLVAAEVEAWLRHLSWDVSEPWRVIAPARRAGILPGLLARTKHGAIAGWTAFMPQGDHLQVMALQATDDAGAAALVRGIEETHVARGARSVIVCVRQELDTLPFVLRTAGFRVDRYRYLSLDLRGPVPGGHGLTGWRADDEAAMARLCARAYRAAPGLRAFAPDDTPVQWSGYLRDLVATSACGSFAPDLSWVVPADGAELAGAVMVTDLGPATAHIAQVAVDPAARGQGMGRQLLEAAISSVAPIFSRVTLLVSESNRPALALYRSLGFVATAGFVVGVKGRQA